MKQYWKNYFWEYLMCVAASSMLLLNTAQGFYIPDHLADNILLAAASCAVLMLFFYMGGCNKAGMTLVPLFAAVLAAVLFLLLRTRGVDIVDEEGSETSFYIYWFAFAVVCAVVYLCSRFRLGIVILLALGTCLNAALQFLEYHVFSWAAMIFSGSCMVLFLLRQYRVQALQSSTADPNFRRFFQTGFVLVLSAAILSCGVFFAVIRPLNPPTIELKFLEKYLAFNIIEHTGISDSYRIPDEELYTDKTNNAADETEKTEEGDTPVDQAADTLYEGDDVKEVNEPAGQEELSAVRYTLTPALWKILWCALFLLVFVLPPALRIWLRKRRLKMIEALEPTEQIREWYRFYLRKFRHVGWEKRPGETPLEYAERCGDGLERYLSGTCGLDRLTAVFMEARYGNCISSDKACEECGEIYALFLNNCKKQMGKMRYLLKFYVL